MAVLLMRGTRGTTPYSPGLRDSESDQKRPAGDLLAIERHQVARRAAGDVQIATGHGTELAPALAWPQAQQLVLGDGTPSGV